MQTSFIINGRKVRAAEKSFKNNLHWDESREYIEKLNEISYEGYNDWRLPTVEEILVWCATCADHKRSLFEGRLPDCDGECSDTIWLWSSEEKDSKYAYGVLFKKDSAPEYKEVFYKLSWGEDYGCIAVRDEA